MIHSLGGQREVFIVFWFEKDNLQSLNQHNLFKPTTIRRLMTLWLQRKPNFLDLYLGSAMLRMIKLITADEEAHDQKVTFQGYQCLSEESEFNLMPFIIAQTKEQAAKTARLTSSPTALEGVLHSVGGEWRSYVHGTILDTGVVFSEAKPVDPVRVVTLSHSFSVSTDQGAGQERVVVYDAMRAGEFFKGHYTTLPRVSVRNDVWSVSPSVRGEFTLGRVYRS